MFQILVSWCMSYALPRTTYYHMHNHMHSSTTILLAIDMDKTCAEEQEILDEAVACCPQCNQEVKAIRSCRCPSSESGPPPAPETTNPPAPTPPVPSPPTAGGGDNEDDPTSQLPLCKDELSVVDNCYATNIDQCDNCDAYDSDTDKTCSEEEGVLNDFVSCCGVCSSQGVDVYDCRCGGASTEGISGVGRVSASHKFSTAITAIVFIGSSVAF